MLLTTRPAEITTHEQNILWSVSQLRQILVSQPDNTIAPRKIIEAEGYYASDVISIQEISPPASIPRHVVRVLMPVVPGYYGATQPVWNFAGTIALALDVQIGLVGIDAPGKNVKIRLNQDVNTGTIQRFDITTSTWLTTTGASGGNSEIDRAYMTTDGVLWVLFDLPDGTYQTNALGSVWAWPAITKAQYDAAIARPGTIRL